MNTDTRTLWSEAAVQMTTRERLALLQALTLAPTDPDAARATLAPYVEELTRIQEEVVGDWSLLDPPERMTRVQVFAALDHLDQVAARFDLDEEAALADMLIALLRFLADDTLLVARVIDTARRVSVGASYIGQTVN